MSKSKNFKSFYAVKKGRNPGIYTLWSECESQVKQYPGAIFKGFKNEQDAIQFLDIPCSKDNTNKIPQKRKLDSSTDSQKKPKPQPSPTPPPPPVQRDRAGFYHNKAVVYTDGACTSNGKSNSQAGCGVFWGENSHLNVSGKLPGPIQTNNRGEMLALIRALESCPRDVRLLNIFSDSEYTINCLTKFRAGIEKREFKASGNSEKPIKNVDMIKYLYALFDNHTAAIKLNWVKGHDNHPDNEAADALAVQGAKMPIVPDDVDWESLAILQSSNADDLFS
ncbi:hypothetical protein E3P92_02761 [Wallemia ichthyophaga]|uniref:Ribonuclease H n=2 Tax=Wallemia ichthyophaga TaxID=245174 RepID=A0A4T0H9W9_WALIC|nr:Ribonuclease H1 [Wallemia ichthyophaga EXF-994]TIA71150.1 hypothetical protein E3P91_02714 [Wallemia ichthyophaga]EOR01281.1 Ribonuclease H1 [Wallemia ichthyophaga EXF-994]TIA80837.1 hypothetical protein E3P98_02448 [Wallemia ichthyophaga]TIA89716.1 hypothetical protein E3P97_02886 [Wallemia ichthyophaga]TIA98348.1 hypothetical protein E3P95_02482 [Wallemia ichthyophaga]